MNNEQFRAYSKELAASVKRGNHETETLVISCINILEGVKDLHTACLHFSVADKNSTKAEKADKVMLQGIKDVQGSLRIIADVTAPQPTGYDIKALVDDDDGGICSDIAWQVTYSGEMVGTFDSYDEARAVAGGEL